MENIKQKLRRSLLYLLGFSAFPMLTSCYGMPENYREPQPLPTVSGGKVITESYLPIRGIKITYTDENNVNKVVFTDDFGEFTFLQSLPIGTVVKVEDVDGDDNGGAFRSENNVVSKDFVIMLKLKK